MEHYTTYTNLDTETPIDKKAYKQFVEGIKKKGYTMDEIKNWTYAGGFWGLGKNCVPSIHRCEDFRLRKKWYDVMGDDIEIPDDEIIEECVCKVHIKWAHIIVNDPEADNPEALIIGSECVRCYSNGGDGLKTFKKCSGCNIRHRNKGDKCTECKKLRVCKRHTCKNFIDKGKRTMCNYCRMSYKNQHIYRSCSHSVFGKLNIDDFLKTLP